MSKWNKEKIHKLSKKYNTRNEFKKNESAAYAAARKLKVLDEVCSHMSSPLNIRTKSEILSIAKKYSTVIDFQNNDNQAYQAARRRGFYEEATSHMKRQKESWTENKIHNIALKYNRRIDFMNNDSKAYGAARRLNLLDTVCSHMSSQFHSWSEQELQIIANKYSVKSDFKRENNPAYQAAIRMNILDKICEHMERGLTGFNPEKRGLVYYIRIDKDGTTVYKIGITNNSVKDRFREESKYITVLRTWEFEYGQKAINLEQSILKEYSYAKYKGEPILKSGNTEMFIDDVLLLDTVAA